jgi:hypothetical protein
LQGDKDLISALQQGKHSVDKKEDVRTSMFFDMLLLLADNLIWTIIRKACYNRKDLPDDAGKLDREDRTAFWPSWDSKNTDNDVRVEPDVFLSFDKFDLIVEAKLVFRLIQTQTKQYDILKV